MADTFQYDVALSFAGEDRSHAESLAKALVASGISVFYDKDERATLWGKDLYPHLQTVYRDNARYCIVFISAAYVRKPWARHELAQAQARAFGEGREYILPIRLDDTEVPGLNATVAYLDLRQTDVAEVARLFLGKLSGGVSPLPISISTPFHGYRLEEGHYPPSGFLNRRLAVPPLCGAVSFPCVGNIERVGQLRQESQWFIAESDAVRNSIAMAVRCRSEDVELVWSVALGPPLTHVLVALIDRQLVVMNLDLDGQTFAPLELVPAFPSPGRCDTRAVACVDFLQEGGRQLLLASDGATGFGLGQTVMAVYRLQGQRLIGIFDEELDFNVALDFEAGIWEERWTSLKWGTARSAAGRPLVHANKTRTLGELRATRTIEYEWNGRRFDQVGRPPDASAEATEEAEFLAEVDRLRQLALKPDR